MVTPTVEKAASRPLAEVAGIAATYRQEPSAGVLPLFLKLLKLNAKKRQVRQFTGNCRYCRTHFRKRQHRQKPYRVLPVAGCRMGWVRSVLPVSVVRREYMIRKGILEAAIQCVTKDRNNSYGEPEANLGNIAALWSPYLRISVTPAQVAGCMILMKLARTMTGHGNTDNHVDMAGYAAIMGELE